MRSTARHNPMIRMATWILLILLAPSLTQAHIGVGETSGLAQGLSHPFLGLDHIAAMVAVGLWAAQLGGTAIWLVPLTFVSLMGIGGVLGIAGVAVPFVEPAILASVLILGLLIAAAVRMPLLASCLLVGLFAVFHGFAHGTETPETATGLAYGLGFILATALLHGCGIGFGLLARRLNTPLLLRYAGGATALLGVYLSFA